MLLLVLYDTPCLFVVVVAGGAAFAFLLQNHPPAPLPDPAGLALLPAGLPALAAMSDESMAAADVVDGLDFSTAVTEDAVLDTVLLLVPASSPCLAPTAEPVDGAGLRLASTEEGERRL